jgi:chorismate mutase
MRIAAIRGATQLDADTPEDMSQLVGELLQRMLLANDLLESHLISAFFTCTPDLTSTFPAAALRDWGYSDLPMMCAQEIAVPTALPRTVRVMVHAYIPSEKRIRHVYLRGAQILRPDLAWENG